jgi:hypothetical protein
MTTTGFFQDNCRAFFFLPSSFAFEADFIIDQLGSKKHREAVVQVPLFGLLVNYAHFTVELQN